MPNTHPEPFSRERQQPTFRYVCLALLFVAAMYYQVRLTSDILQGIRVDVPFIAAATASASLDIVDPAAEKLGLHAGDMLLAVNGVPYTGTSVLGQAFSQARPGDTVQVTLQDPSGTRTVTLPVTPEQTRFPRPFTIFC